MKKIFYGCFDIEGITMYAGATEQGLCRLDFMDEKKFFDWMKKHFKDYELINDDSEFTVIKGQLKAYFEKKETIFDIKIDLVGTEFQKKVWERLINIPYGETVCYQEVAKVVGGNNYCRAVGGAIHNNPILIVVPCHRVIGKDGSLVGFAGGLDLKKKLLGIESL